MSSLRKLWNIGRGADQESDIELGHTNDTASTYPEVHQTPATVAPLNPMPQQTNTLVTSAGSLNTVAGAAPQFMPGGMPLQVQQINTQIEERRQEPEINRPMEKRRREPEISEPATKLRAVEGPTASLVSDQIRRVEDTAREAHDAHHQTVINKMNNDFAIIVQGHESNIENIKAQAKETEETLKNEIDKAKKKAERAQNESVEFRGMLAALQKQFNDFKESTTRVPDGNAMSQGDGEPAPQHTHEVAQFKLESEAAMEEQKKKMAEMESQMAGFKLSLNNAEATIADLRSQLKITQEQASRADSENSKYRNEISALKEDLRTEQNRCEELEAATVERDIAPDAGDSSSAPIPHQGSTANDPEDVQLASQHEDVEMTSRVGPTSADDDMYEADEDDRMDGNTSSNVRHGKSVESQPRSHATPSRIAGAPAPRHQVPPPQKVTAPRGGQGNPTRMALQDPRSNRVHQAPAKKTKNHNAGATGDLFNEDEDINEEQDSDADDESDDARNIAKGRKGRDSKRLNVFSNPKLRKRRPNRTKLLGMVRKLMNQILGIAKDKDVIEVELATPEEVERYEKDQNVTPTSEGFRPTFQKGFATTQWHRYLEEAFIEQFVEVHNVELKEDNRDTIAEMFTDRLTRLRKTWRHLKKEMTPAERAEWKARVESMSRRNVRRLNVFDFRRTICLESIETPEGREDKAWKAMFNMILALGPGGMSSDESNVQNGRAVYYVRKRHWRSAEATDRCLFVDGQRNTRNGAGGPRPGNAPRVRVRTAQLGETSPRDPTIECPENLYDEGYVQGLSNLHFRALKMAPAMDLGYMRHV